MKLEEVSSIPSSLRTAYLRSIPEAQELFLEQLFLAATKVLFTHEDRLIGYAAIHKATLVECFIVESEVLLLHSAFALVCERFSITRALCKSFDAQMIAAASLQPAQVKTVAHLFRRYASASAPLSLVARRGTREDISAVLEMHDGFFDSPSEIEEYAGRDGLLLFESGERSLVACGVMRRIIEGRDDFDVGMVVRREQRGRGIGAGVVSYLATHCLRSGHQPVCGCSAENVASRRTLERAGFRTAHSLLAFSYLARS